MEKTRSPRFLGNPCLRAPLFNPGGISPSGLSRRLDVAFRVLNHVDSRDKQLSKLNHAASRLAVYA
jgi:hypothetical protein